MGFIRLIVGFIITYGLMFIARGVPLAGPIVVGAIGALIARCGSNCGFLLGFFATVFEGLTLAAYAYANGADPGVFGWAFIGAAIDGLLAGVGGAIAGRLFEQKSYYTPY